MKLILRDNSRFEAPTFIITILFKENVLERGEGFPIQSIIMEQRNVTASSPNATRKFIY